MIYIDNENVTDPQINLALEEYALKNLPVDETYLLFYTNEPCIIIGKNQNTHEEINKKFVDENDIYVVRRLSGGGAVYQDLGNLNFSFLTKDDGDSFSNYAKFTEPVIEALRQLGVEAELSGRNDIQVGERKISGNAQYTTKGRMFSHGTLLVDVEMENIVDSLNVNEEKIRSKGIKSVRARVANINEFTQKAITVDELKKIILAYVFKETDIETYRFTKEQWKEIYALAEERYKNWDWNYGKSPKFDLKRSKRFEGAGTIDVRLDVSKGTIQACKIFGDFFGMGDISVVEEKLVGVKYDKNAIHEALETIDMTYYFGKVSREGFIELIY
ncbi:lipoate--protein ligase [Paenalkalicoccus suaedae]|uniref:lipoate--protein ligase n=1 Tax=Paenalkalicoccus suaedae TaxID=2592382 RepID=A0A859FCM2_9BACI|nr:lipoate--protein ligase [Paenalkalicoccus suaedae]QKS70817.1 lipoate--protein ligase [Paenalkalicoccus suaedae]